jgi:hypothetical protein
MPAAREPTTSKDWALATPGALRTHTAAAAQNRLILFMLVSLAWKHETSSERIEQVLYNQPSLGSEPPPGGLPSPTKTYG